MSTPLDEKTLTDAVHRLKYWSVNGNSIERTIDLTPPRYNETISKLNDVTVSLSHQPTITRYGNRVLFSVTTPSAGNITEADIALASHINRIVHTVVSAL